LKVLFVHNHYRVRSGEALVFEHDRRAAELAGHDVITYTRDNRELDDSGLLQRRAHKLGVGHAARPQPLDRARAACDSALRQHVAVDLASCVLDLS